jgi:NADP-dependent 3-hydroxy acid dehydrogenase YdfG
MALDIIDPSYEHRTTSIEVSMITGAARGIGATTARCSRREGAAVAWST